MSGESTSRALLPPWSDLKRSMISGPRARHVAGSRIAKEFEKVAAQSPHKLAVVSGGAALTYDRLLRSADALSARLRDIGLRDGTVIGVLMSRSVAYVVTLLAVLRADAVYAPLEPSDPPGRISKILDSLRPDVIISDTRESRKGFAAGPETVTVDNMTWYVHVPSVRGTTSRDDAPRGTTACLMSTSGSSGEPKHVIVPHRAILNLARNKAFDFITSDDVFLFHSPVTFDASTFEIWTGLLSGAKLVILDRPHSTLKEIADAIAAENVTTLWLPAALFDAMVDFELSSLRGLRTLIAGGDVVSARHMQKAFFALPGLRLMNGYGPTECTTFTCCFVMSADYSAASSIPIGRPISNVAVCILDDRGQPVREGEEGELCVTGAGLSDGYLRAASMAAAVFPSTRGPGGKPQRFYRTGDVARQLPDGNIDFRGRRDNQIKLRGYRIELEEVERAINSHPQIQKSAVHVENTGGEKRLIATVVAKANSASWAPSQDAGFYDQYVTHWQNIYDARIYKDLISNRSRYRDDFNTTGWVDTYTGAPLTPDEMEIQAQETSRRILCHAPARILEVGCGSGLLTHRLINHCNDYVGIDISHSAVDFVRASLDRYGPRRVGRVEIRQWPAHKVADLNEEPFDCIVLNSVVQHFPSVDYFLAVLSQCIGVAMPQAVVFVGDVRCLPLLRAFHTSVQLARAAPAMPCRHLRDLVDLKVAREQELLVDPSLFRASVLADLGIAATAIHLKRGRAQNELNRFRYDALLYLQSVGASASDPIEIDGAAGPHCLKDVARFARADRDKPVLVRNIKNTRVVRALSATRMMDSGDGSMTVDELRALLDAEFDAASVDPEDIWSIGEDVNVPISLQWPANSRLDCFDAHLHVPVEHSGKAIGASNGTTTDALSRREMTEFANSPGARARQDSVEASVRSHLSDRLPAYMIPARFAWRDTLPIDSRGKLDRTALRRAAVDSRKDPRSQTEVERVVGEIWAEVLQEAPPDMDTNFFELGGDSLTAIRVAAKLGQALGVHLPAHTLFEKMTIRRLAAEITSRIRRSAHSQEAVGPGHQQTERG